MPEETLEGRITRRAVLTGAATAAAAAGFVPVTAIRSAAQTAPAPQRIFTPEQKRTLEAFLGRLCPKDELGPGAVEIGAQDYIEVQLGDYLAPEKDTFLRGLAAVDAYARAPARAAGWPSFPQTSKMKCSTISTTAGPPRRLARFSTGRGG